MWGVERGEKPCWPVCSFGEGPGSQSVSVGCQMPIWDGESFGGAGRVRRAELSVIQLPASSLRLCLGTLGTAEHQMLIRIIKGL